ncbi:MAG TPA: hypothetical protein ENJ82_08245 [Bacteroidetes bacterium]|nr:hypothetical protein [Bacteroidota bacterium]
MKRLISLEFHKLRGHRSFWVLFGLYLITLLLTILAFQGILNGFFQDEAPKAMSGLLSWDLNAFPDNWHYLTWLAGFFHYTLAVIVIILICNEFSYRTVRQNIIDGLSRTEFLMGKFLMLLIFAAVSTILLFASIMFLGLTSSTAFSGGEIVEKMPFILAFFLQLVGYLMVAFLIGMLVRRVGIAIGIFFIYAWFLEKVAVYYAPEATERFFPINAMNNMINFPFTTMEPIQLLDVGISVFYVLALLGAAYLFLMRRDL